MLRLPLMLMEHWQQKKFQLEKWSVTNSRKIRRKMDLSLQDGILQKMEVVRKSRTRQWWKEIWQYLQCSMIWKQQIRGHSYITGKIRTIWLVWDQHFWHRDWSMRAVLLMLQIHREIMSHFPRDLHLRTMYIRLKMFRAITRSVKRPSGESAREFLLKIIRLH